MSDTKTNEQFIIDFVKGKLNEQNQKISEYINTYMTQEERDRHGNNLYVYLLSPELLETLIESEMIVKGRK